MRKYTYNTSFLLSEEELALLEKSASDRRVSRSEVVRELIRQNLAATAKAAA
jgi:Arc/MetJ-type ribon-helix-helix transcriptional regulator